MVKVNILNKSNHPLPQYETSGASGMDARANIPSGQIIIKAGEKILIPTGLFVEIPEGYEIQVRPRSGISFKTDLVVVNSPGTIDSCYRGEIKVIMKNTSDRNEYSILDGDKIAQLVLCPVSKCEWFSTDQLSDTDRGQAGFGSTGI